MCQKALTSELERSARAAYQALANNYYTDLHPTSKAFSWTLDRYLEYSAPKLIDEGTYLEVGSGRSRIQSLAGAQNAQLFLLDISELMLRPQSDSEGSRKLGRVQGSAFALPFAELSMNGVFSFLGDAFSNMAYYAEVQRVAKSRAKFLHVIPHFEWGQELRRLLGIPRDITFFANDGTRITAPSLLPGQDIIERDLRSLGFDNVSFRELCLPGDYPVGCIPEHIILPSKSLNISPYTLKILLAVDAEKN